MAVLLVRRTSRQSTIVSRKMSGCTWKRTRMLFVVIILRRCSTTFTSTGHNHNRASVTAVLAMSVLLESAAMHILPAASGLGVTHATEAQGVLRHADQYLVEVIQ